jgi:hypothetical protein
MKTIQALNSVGKMIIFMPFLGGYFIVCDRTTRGPGSPIVWKGLPGTNVLAYWTQSSATEIWMWALVT